MNGIITILTFAFSIFFVFTFNFFIIAFFITGIIGFGGSTIFIFLSLLGFCWFFLLKNNKNANKPLISFKLTFNWFKNFKIKFCSITWNIVRFRIIEYFSKIVSFSNEFGYHVEEKLRLVNDRVGEKSDSYHYIWRKIKACLREMTADRSNWIGMTIFLNEV